eukprot:3531297-Rhodomonas_salina.3
MTDGLGYCGGTSQLVAWVGVPYPSLHLLNLNDDDNEWTIEEGRISDAAGVVAASTHQRR